MLWVPAQVPVALSLHPWRLLPLWAHNNPQTLANPGLLRRYLSHFRCIHRGAYFQELRTTAVRKLLPDSWGFMCPVHTPDGSPCGLLLHLTAACRVAAAPPGEPDSVQAAIAMVRTLRTGLQIN